MYTLLLSLTLLQVEMADAMRASGKIYVVVAVVLVIFILFVLYMALIDRKIRKIEQERNKK